MKVPILPPSILRFPRTPDFSAKPIVAVHHEDAAARCIHRLASFQNLKSEFQFLKEKQESIRHFEVGKKLAWIMHQRWLNQKETAFSGQCPTWISGLKIAPFFVW